MDGYRRSKSSLVSSLEPQSDDSEEGYTLVALLALMTILALFAAAAAPSIRQQAQRDREVEAIFRGEQVAAAIRLYYFYRQGDRMVAMLVCRHRWTSCSRAYREERKRFRYCVHPQRVIPCRSLVNGD
jgi:Tfp pilus assembly protein PilE